MSTDTNATDNSTDPFTTTTSKAALVDFVDPISRLTDECKVRFHENHLTITAVDPGNVGMAYTTLPEENLDQYAASIDVIGLNLDRFEDIISMAEGDETQVSLTLDQRTRKLTIVFDGLEYTMALIDPDSVRQEPDIPELDLSGEVVLEGRQFGRALTASEMVSDHVSLGINTQPDVFNVKADGDTDDVNVDLGREDLVDLSAADVRSLFSLDYLTDMHKAIPKDAEVTLEIGDEFPVKIHYDYPETEVETTFMLAPRIQSD